MVSKFPFWGLVMFGLLIWICWSPSSDNVLVKDAEAVVGRPATPRSAAGVARRTTRRRVHRRVAIGARVTVLPVGYTTVVVTGATYYVHEEVYYKAHYEG
ncbi:MAG: hypothetical protein V3S05_00490, partial [Desulfobacterales bacterium]